MNERWSRAHPGAVRAVVLGALAAGALLGGGVTQAVVSAHLVSPDNVPAGVGIGCGSVLLGLIAGVLVLWRMNARHARRQRPASSTALRQGRPRARPHRARAERKARPVSKPEVQVTDLTAEGSRYAEVRTPAGIIRVNAGLVDGHSGKPAVTVEIEPNTSYRRVTGPGGEWGVAVTRMPPASSWGEVTLTRQDLPRGTVPEVSSGEAPAEGNGKGKERHGDEPG